MKKLCIALWLCLASAVAFGATCTSGQKPYATPTICGIGPQTGDTVVQACNAVLPYLGGTVTASGNVCTFTGDCGGGPRTVAQVCEPAGTTPPTTTTGTVTATGVVCNGTCTVTIKHEFEHPTTAAPLTASMVGDYMELWAAFMVAAVVILCAKAIYNRFRIDYEG